MTLNEFNEIILKDVELQKKYDAEKEVLSKEGIKDKFELCSKAATKLGFDVPASEFQLAKISRKELNESELEAVTGGGRGGVDCRSDFTDTDCFMSDYCNIGTNSYTLYTCMYSHDGFCALEDACWEIDIQYYCDGNYTYKQVRYW